MLTAPFSDDEIKDAIFSNYPEGLLDQMVSPFVLSEILEYSW